MTTLPNHVPDPRGRPELNPDQLLAVLTWDGDDDATLTIFLVGDLDVFTVPALLTALLDIEGALEADLDATTVEIDLSGLGFLDSAGLTALVAGETALSAVCGQVRMVGARPTVQRLVTFASAAGWFPSWPAW